MNPPPDKQIKYYLLYIDGRPLRYDDIYKLKKDLLDFLGFHYSCLDYKITEITQTTVEKEIRIYE